MSEYYHIVPWYNTQEWLTVYEKVFAPTSSFASKQEALKQLLIWKARCPSLPSGVESTLTLLEVIVQDLKSCEDTGNDQLLRLAYSSAIMRFVNHMLDTETAKGTSLYKAAASMGVPDWIIDMRHDTAHSNTLPSIELLREASTISLDWLQSHYWEKHKESISDYISGQEEIDSTEYYKSSALISFCIALSICAHPKCKIKKLSDIPDAKMRASIVNDASDLYSNLLDLSNLKTVSLASLVNTMNAQAKRFLKAKNAKKYAIKALLSEDSLFLSLELLNTLDKYNLGSNKPLSRNYIQCFEMLLTFIHTNYMMLELILELIKLTQSEDQEMSRRHLAALWVSEILMALNRSKQFMEKINTNNPDMKQKTELRSLFHHQFPNEHAHVLLLDLQKPVPYELTNINNVQPIISSYNPYLTYFVKDLLALLDPPLPNETKNKICNLAKLISSPEKFKATSSKIHTVDDVDNGNGDVICLDQIEDNSNYCNEPGDTSSQAIHSKWQLASSDHDWASCPIGQLPWQMAIPK